MAVKVENRPENRFIVLTKIEASKAELLKAFTSQLFSDIQKEHLLKLISKSRAKALAFNACDVFSPVFYPIRAQLQAEAYEALCEAKAYAEASAEASSINPEKLGSFLRSVSEALEKLSHLMKADEKRNSKGKEQAAAEHREAKHQKFYVPQHHDHAQTDPKVLGNKDPFGLGELIFDFKQ